MGRKTQLTEKQKARDANLTEYLFDAMQPIEGECRTVERCDDCGRLFGRRYIPYGIGEGLSVNLCPCQLTARRPFTTVATREP